MSKIPQFYDPDEYYDVNTGKLVHRSNILDPIHAELDARVWDNPASAKPVLKPLHAHWIKREVYKTLEEAGYTDIETWLTLVFTGSLTTYQYSDESDVDISLFVDTKVFPEWSRAEMIALMVDKLDGTILPGTPFPLQDFVVAEGIKPTDLYKPGLRSGYDIDVGRWIVPPERDRVHDVKSEEGGFYAWALQMADKMERLLRYEPDAAVRFWHSIHKKRRVDMMKGKGDYAESNVIYKMLAQRGLFPSISQASGEYIAKTATPFRPDYGVATRPFSADDEVATRPFRPDDEEWMQGQCAAYVDGLCQLRPDLRLGIQWDDHFPTNSEDYPEGEQPEFETMPHHYFAHDDHYAYDAMGRHPLPYQGEGDRVTYDHDPKDVRHYGMYEGGYVAPAMQHAQENDIFNKDAYEQGRWNIAKTVISEASAEHIAATKPPHLRESEGQKACWNCWAYDNGHCEMFGGYKVREDQVCDDWEKTKKSKTSANNLLYDREQHPEGKGFILDDGSVWTWPTTDLRPMHMQYAYKAKQQGRHLVPGSAFHIKDGQVWQYGPGRSLSPEQHQTIFAADPSLELAPSKQQEQLDTTPGYGHGQNVLDILQRGSSWAFQGATNIHDVAARIYEKALEGVGATINLHGETPKTRYGFAPDPATDTPIPPQEFSPESVEAFIGKWAARLRQPDKYIGSWMRDDGMIVLDVSEGHDDFDEAFRRAWAANQMAIWDNLNQEAIPVRDSGYGSDSTT